MMNTWWEDIRKEVNSRKRKCVLQGMNRIYDLHGKNPYTYPDVAKFKGAIPFTTKDCVLPNRKAYTTDKKKTYYKDVDSADTCYALDGIWAPNSLNRRTRYERGVCWKTEDDAKCAAVVDNTPMLLQQRERAKKSQEFQDKVINNKKNDCNKVQGCVFKNVTNGYDCFAQKTIERVEGIVADPPAEMPTNPTDPGFEEFLHKWYSGALDSRAPSILKSTGVGCGTPSSSSSSANANSLENTRRAAKNRRFTKTELSKMNPLIPHHGIYLRIALGETQFIEYFENYSKAAKRRKIYELDWSTVSIYEEVEDELISTEENQELKYGKPSVAQSVVNMVMKNIALKNSTARGLLALHSTGSGKCHAKDTLIMMHNGTLKKVQDILVGDQVMGDDSKPRTVLSLGQGQDNMYDIIQGDEKYTVNSEHIMCLKYESDEDTVMEIEVCNYLKLPPALRQMLRGYRVSVEFPSKELEPRCDPYNFGLWLGDDSLLTSTSIPEIYKCNDRNVRLKLLAGIIDSKGTVDIPNNRFLIAEQSESFTKDIVFVARSLGLATNVTINYDCLKTHQIRNYIISISGPVIDDIPCFSNLSSIITHKLDRHTKEQSESETHLMTEIQVQHVGWGDYYGFTLDGNHRYLLGDFTVTHNTCTATGVMDAFWDTNKEIVFVSSIDALASNPPFKFHECAQRLFPRWRKKTLEQVQREFEIRGVRFLSFAKLANRILDDKKKKEQMKLKDGVDLDNSVLIIDEVHNLFRPLPNQREKHRIVEKHIVDVSAHPALKMVVLTATPGDNIEDTMKLINMVRDPILKPSVILPPSTDQDNSADITRFVNDIRGLISFYDLSSDLSRFPLLIDTEPVKYPMSHKQFVKYFEAYSKIKKEWKDYDKLAKGNQLAKWWVGARRYANMLYTFEKGMSLTEFSSKLPALLTNLEDQFNKNEKSYVYSAFYENKGSSHGIWEIARQLEKMGWKPITMADVKQFKEGKLKEGKRFMVASQKEKHFQEFIKVYNSDQNSYGKLIGCMVATQNFNEGLDLKAVRHIHIFEPLVTMASDLQTRGRAARLCSHQNLDQSKGEWTTQMWRYIATLGDYSAIPTKPKRGRKKQDDLKSSDGVVASIDDKSIDEIVFEESRLRYKQLFDISNSMKLAAVDYLLTNDKTI